MNPDGMSYLDVGDAFFRHDWSVALNGWWSPLYPWIIGTVLGIAKSTAALEFPVVQFVNFIIFILTLFAFRFFLHSLLRFVRGRASEGLPEWAVTLLAYAVFLWIALEVETLYDVSPDMGVVACFCLSMGMLLRLETKTTLTGSPCSGSSWPWAIGSRHFCFPWVSPF